MAGGLVLDDLNIHSNSLTVYDKICKNSKIMMHRKAEVSFP